jgi:cytochrome c oxidase subunit 3
MSVAHGEQLRTLEEHGEVEERSMGWWGMIFFIASEALIFANFIAAYLYLEIRNGNWPVGGSAHPLDLTYPIINTFILLGSSIPAHFLVGRGIQQGNQLKMKLGLFVTIIMGAAFLGGQVYEYRELYSTNFTPQANVQGSSFFMLTGFHGLHVTIGLIFLIIVFLRALRGDFTTERHFAVQAAEMYWHFVDGVWVFVFSLVYLLPLIR